MKSSFAVLLVVTIVLIPGITLLTTLHVLLLACLMGVDPLVPILTSLTPQPHLLKGGTNNNTGVPSAHRPTTRGRPRPRRPSYYEIEESKLAPPRQQADAAAASSSYQLATVIDSNNSTTASWFRKRKLCKETCCVETVAISLQQEEHQIINTKNGRELADLTLQHRPPPKSKEEPTTSSYFASHLHESILPCLVPGTIIQIDNHFKDLYYFWIKLRPLIQVPYILITSGSDAFSPQGRYHNIGDPLLLKWYGTNPKPTSLPAKSTNPSHQDWSYQQYLHKFQPMMLGLRSYQQQPQQHRLLESYLEFTNYTNPFVGGAPYWQQSILARREEEIDFDRDIFVHFDYTLPGKQQLWDALCGGDDYDNDDTGDDDEDQATNNASAYSNSKSNKNRISCNRSVPEPLIPTPALYKEMSSYKFGVCPTGVGWDTHRTYELLLLGVIPIISSNEPFSKGEMFHGLPIIQIPNLEYTIRNRQQLIQAINNWLDDQQQQQQDKSSIKTSEEEDIGWNKLFLRYQRRQILRDSNREHEIIKDDKGREYYQAYRYTTRGADKGTSSSSSGDNNDNSIIQYCEQKGSCEVDETTKQNWKTTILNNNKNVNHNNNRVEESEEKEQQQQQWLESWKQL